MEWISNILLEHSALQSVIVISIICAIGLMLGKMKVAGVSLGVTFVFFMGILAGHLGITIDPQTTNYVESFGLVLFVYALGIQVGPGFFSSFRKGGVQLNMIALGVVLFGTILAIIPSYVLGVSIPDMMGILSGAVTNTPSLAAAQQALSQLGLPSSSPALGCAVTYPLGVVGVILALLAVRKIFGKYVRIAHTKESSDDHTFVAEFQILNPAVFGRSIRDIARLSGHPFVISRLWRDGAASIPTSDTELRQGDHILVVSSDSDSEALTILFGAQENKNWNEKDIDWNKIDSHVISARILITRPELNGKKLGSLRLRNHYGVNTTRIFRSGVQLLATPDLRLQFGDRITVVGEANAVENVEKLLGNAVLDLEEPNLIAVFVGMVLGLLLGAIPLAIPGMNVPVSLGIAGGPIIVGILIGTFGPRLHMVTYVTRSANLMLRALGMSIYLACLGLDAGAHFFETVFRPEGLLWVALGFGITIIPVLIAAFICMRFSRLDFGTISGMLCGSMANPMALDYSNDTLKSDKPSVAYATVYPLCMFVRVIIAQIVIVALCH